MPRSTIARRDLLQYGFAGFVASTLISKRSWGQNAATPRRLILFYMPAGFFPSGWRSNLAAGASAPLGNVTFGSTVDGVRQNILDALDTPAYSALRQELIMLDGVDMRSVEGYTSGNSPTEHDNGIWAALRGRPITFRDNPDPGPFNNWSIDRVIGANLFLDQPRPLSLKSACLNVLLGDFGYGRDIRQASAGGTSLECSNLPALWDAVFKDFTPPTGGAGAPAGPSQALVDRHARQQLLAGQTRAELNALLRRLGREEQIALERHLEAMNELTTQVNNDYAAASQATSAPATAAGQVPPKPSAVDGRTQLVPMTSTAAKVIANAMAFDRIRVATMHTFGHNNNESRWYPGASGAFHDGVCHGGHSGDKLAGITLTANKTIIKMFLDIMLTLKSIPEGSGTMLDTTTVASFSDMANGDHQYKTPTLFLIGGGGGWTAAGKRVWSSGRAVKLSNRGHSDYLVSLAHGMGVTTYADATGARKPLTQIGAARWNQGPLPGLTT